VTDPDPKPHCIVRSGREATRVPHPSLDSVFRLEERIVVSPPSAGGRSFATEGFSPLRVGFLSDMPMGDQLGGYLDPIILALEDAMTEGPVHQRRAR
jgi:hypothetical protein